MSHHASGRRLRRRVVVRVGLVLVWVVGLLGEPLQAVEPMSSRNEVEVSVGQVLFVHSRSLAYSHLFRVGCGLQWMRRVDRQWAWGWGGEATATRDRNYQIASVQLRGRRQWDWLAGKVGIGAGVGVGRNAPILSADLQANAAVVPVVSVAADVRWRVAPGVSLGIGASSQLFATVQLRGLAGVAF